MPLGIRHVGTAPLRRPGVPRCLDWPVGLADYPEHHSPGAHRMDFLDGVTSAQRLAYQSARQFARSELVPLVATHPGDQSLTRRVVARMAEIGLLGGPFPAEYGGAEADHGSYCLVCEAVGAVSPSLFTGALTVQVSLVATAIHRYGSGEQRNDVLRSLLTGQSVGAFALTEPDSGSDPAAARTLAQRSGDGWTLNGTKLWISNGSIADWLVVFAQTEPGSRNRGMAAFLVPAGTPGVSARRIEGKLGLAESDTAEVQLDNVQLPGSALLGQVGDGARISQASLQLGRLSTAACAVGIGQECLERSVDYAKTRQQWGKPIGGHQLVQGMIAEIAVATHAARLMVHDAAARLDAGQTEPARVAMAKQFATDAAVRSARQAIAVHGAVGYVDEMRVGTLLRDAIGLSLYEGTNQVQTLLIGRELLGIAAF